VKTSTVNGVTYELPDGWEPIETVPLNVRVQVKYTNGESCPVTFDALNYRVLQENKTRIAWQHIVAPKVMPWKPKYREEYFFVDGSGQICASVWTEDAADKRRYAIGNCYPTESAAAPVCPLVIAAHNGGAKWKGGV